MKKSAILTLLIVVGLLSGTFSAYAAAPSGEPIKIGAVYNLTGAQASLDAPSANGAKLAVKEINASGGVLGRPLELVLYDGKTDAATVANAATQLVESDKVAVMMGFSDTDPVLAAAPIAAKAGIVFVTSGATSPKLVDQVPDYLFMACFGDNVQAAAGAEYAFNTLKAKTAYLLYDKGMEYTLLLGKFFKDRFVELGGKIVLEDTYQTGDKDYSAQITKLKAAGAMPDLVYIASGPDDVGTVVKQFRDSGVDKPIMGGDGYDTPLLVQIAGKGSDNVYFTTHSLMDDKLGTDAVKKFIADYNTEYKTAPENAFAALGYDTVKLIADAITRAKAADPKALREALATTKGLKGVTGSITFQPGSRIPQKGVTVILVKDGKTTLAAEVVPEKVPGAAAPAKSEAAPASTVPPVKKVDTAGKTLRIVYIPKNTGNPYFDSIIAGFKKAAEELGYEFTTVAPSTAEGTGQIPFIKEQVQRGVDAIAISPNDPAAVVPALQQAMGKNIRVVCVNSDMPGNIVGREVAVLPMDFNVTGSSQVELLGSVINYEGEIAILSATTTAPDQNFWIEGMKEALKDPKYAKMKLVKIAYGDDDPQKSYTEAQALLTAFPNLKGIISPTTVGVAAAAQAVETAKAAAKVQVVGLGTPNQMRRFIQNGTVTKFALWSPYNEGYMSGYMIYGMLTGQVKPAVDATFGVPTLGDRVFLKDNVVITGPPQIFDKDNIDQFNF